MATTLGIIFGIIIVIFGIIYCAGLIHYAINYDFDKPICTTEITVSFKVKENAEIGVESDLETGQEKLESSPDTTSDKNP